MRDEVKVKELKLQRSELPNTKWNFKELGIIDILLPFGQNGKMERANLASILKMVLRQIFNSLSYFKWIDSKNSE